MDQSPSWARDLPKLTVDLRVWGMDRDRENSLDSSFLLSTAQNPVTSPFPIPEGAVSQRELEIIELVAKGLTNQEIAKSLTISKRTVDNHVSNIFTKTGAKNRVALSNWAMDNGKICRDGFNCCALDQG